MTRLFEVYRQDRLVARVWASSYLSAIDTWIDAHPGLKGPYMARPSMDHTVSVSPVPVAVQPVAGLDYRDVLLD